MPVKNRLSRSIKVFGSIYLFLNCIICVVMGIFAIRAFMTTNMSPGFVVFILPLIGIFSGYWMRTGKYGWWRVLIITISCLFTVAIVFTAIFIAPKMNQHKQNKFKTGQKVKSLKPEIEQMFLTLYADDPETVRQQLEKGADVNAVNDTGQTPLHVTQDTGIAKMLILKGANVNALDGDGMTPMFSKDLDLIKVLTESGADINHRSNKGNTPLIWYSYSGYLEGIQLLFSLGADVNAKNTDGQTALDIAEIFGHLELLGYLKSVGAKSGKQDPE